MRYRRARGGSESGSTKNRDYDNEQDDLGPAFQIGPRPRPDDTGPQDQVLQSDHL